MLTPYAAKGCLFKGQTRARKSRPCGTLGGVTAREVLVLGVTRAVYTSVFIVNQQRDGGLRPKSLSPCNS